jgi:hypothetical protein
MAYIGNEPGVGSFIVATERFNGTGACTQFTITQTGISDANAVEVIVSNVQQDPINSYSISSGVITFTEAPPSGTQNIIVTYRATTVITYTNIQNSQIPDGTISATKLASGVLPTATANSAASYANSAFAVANTGAGAVTSGSYANSGFAVANSAASYGNSAFAVANNNTGINATQNTNITIAATYANSGFSVANSAASYANASFATANTGTASGSYANSAFAKANAVPALATAATTATTATNATNTIGNSQSYGDYIGSRSINTTYTNSTGKPIWVAVAWTATGNGDYSATVNGSLAYFSRQDLYPRANVDFIVPIGGTYSVSNTAGQGPAFWYELR